MRTSTIEHQRPEWTMRNSSLRRSVRALAKATGEASSSARTFNAAVSKVSAVLAQRELMRVSFKDGNREYDLDGVLSFSVNVDPSTQTAAQRIAESLGGGFGNGPDPDYTIDLELEDTGSPAQLSLLALGYAQGMSAGGKVLPFPMTVSVPSGSRRNFHVLVTHYASGNGVLQISYHTVKPSKKTGRAEPVAAQRGALVPDDAIVQGAVINHAESLMNSPNACHVCGESTIVKGADGRPEHPTCGAWGAA